MPHFFRIFTAVVLPLLTATLTISAASKTASIASPEVCHTVHECPKAFYCKNFDLAPRYLSKYNSKPSVCKPRLRAGEACNPTDPFACRTRLHCPRLSRGFLSACKPLPSKPGAICDPSRARACTDGLRCTSEGRCRSLPGTGGVGLPCKYDFSCAIENKLACNQVTKKCVSGRRRNDSCFPYVPSQYAWTSEPLRTQSQGCLGYCQPAGSDSGSGTCQKRSAAGERCQSDLHCWNEAEIPQFRENPQRCNYGRCAAEQTLIKQLGAPCDSQLDLCDDRRALKCLRSALKKQTVCQQLGGDGEYCTPGSPFSRCEGVGEDGKPLECRESRNLRGYTASFPTDMRYFLCLQQSILVDLGGVCIYDVEKCPKGSFCTWVPYYQSAAPEIEKSFSQFSCMNLLPAGANCTKNKETSGCGAGLMCEPGGRCVQADGSFREPVIRAGLYARCSKELPCAPGLNCTGTADFRYCSMFKTKVGVGSICGRAVRRDCKDGLSCARVGSVSKCVRMK